jgi:hypothetical protein
MAKIALLVSRQPRHATPQTWWVRAVRAACDHLVSRGDGLVTGEGLPPMDLARWIVSFRRGSVTVVPAPPGPKSAALAARDRLVAETADTLIAIDVRSGGVMERVALEALAARRTVQVLRPHDEQRIGSSLDGLMARGATPLDLEIPAPPPALVFPLSPAAAVTPPKCLWHFTRRAPGPWPGQSQDDYFAALVGNLPGAAHSARDTLDRILRDNRIRACGRLYRGGYPMAAFTEADPDDLMRLRRFRSALHRWDFEPVGVGIRLDAALAAGLRPVFYRGLDAFGDLEEADRPYFQMSAPGHLETEHEREWRHHGDLDLRAIPEEAQYLYDSGLCVPRRAHRCQASP